MDFQEISRKINLIPTREERKGVRNTLDLYLANAIHNMEIAIFN